MANEAEFLKTLKKSFEQFGSFFYKIPDMPHFKGQMTRFDVKKPFDVIVVADGIPIAIEAKFLKEYKSFGMKDLRPNQIKGLDDFEKNGGASFVFLNVRRPRDYSNELPPCNKLLIFPWGEFKAREKNYFKKDLVLYPCTDFKKGVYPEIKNFLRVESTRWL